MKKDDIKEDILKKLSFNVSPKLLRYINDVDNSEYQIILEELIAEGYITADISNNGNGYDGDYTNIKLTSKAKNKYKGLD